MPFAPSITDDKKRNILLTQNFPYMIMAFDSTIDGEDRIPTTIHPFDRRCRPQTVKTEWIPRYYKIIKTFELTTGIGDILNTSFNLHGYPMVGT
jgi:carbamoyltransferase